MRISKDNQFGEPILLLEEIDEYKGTLPSYYPKEMLAINVFNDKIKMFLHQIKKVFRARIALVSKPRGITEQKGLFE